MTLPDLPGLDWHPTLPVTLVYALAIVAALTAVAFILFTPALRAWAKPPVLLLRLATITALAAIALNPVATEKSPQSRRPAALLTDNSASMQLGSRMKEATDFSSQTVKEAGTTLAIDRFTYGAETHAIGADAEIPAPNGRTTRLGDAIRRALDSQPPPASLLITGDGGGDDRAELNAAAQLAKSRGVPIHVHPVGGDDPMTNAWIAGIRAPRNIRPQGTASLQVFVGSHAISRPLALRLLDSAGTVLATTQVQPADEPVSTRLEFIAGIRGANYRLELEKPAEDVIAEDNSLTFPLEVSSPKIRVLYMEGTHSSHQVQMSGLSARWNTMELTTRAWDAAGEIEFEALTPLTQYANSKNLFRIQRFLGGAMEIDTTRGFPKTREELFTYDVVISSDIPRGNFSEEEMEWVVDLVTKRGGGFCMIGGHSSFDSGDYDKTPWEKITPVDMVEYGHGYVVRNTPIQIPESARNHPIWRISPDSVENNRILDTHPTFLGYHDIRRAKPGAVNLGLHTVGGEPLITVQSYGRGRSMAFLTDSNGGWGERYVHWGEEKSGGRVIGSTEIGQGPQVLEGTRGMTDKDAVPSAMGHPSPYYAQFWVNTVRWLAENSIRRIGEGINGRAADSVARPGAELPVTAEITADMPAEELASLNVTARLLLPGSRPRRLDWNPDRREFTGTIPIPAELTEKTVPVIFECEGGTRKLNDRIDLPVLLLNPEIEHSQATPGLLRDLAATTGGREVSTPTEAAAALEADIARLAKHEIILLRPAWDRPLFWALLAGLLGTEWLLRKLARREG